MELRHKDIKGQFNWIYDLIYNHLPKDWDEIFPDNQTTPFLKNSESLLSSLSCRTEAISLVRILYFTDLFSIAFHCTECLSAVP